MAALTSIAAPMLAAALALAVPVAASAPATQTPVDMAPAVERWRPYMAEASRRFGVPQAWIAAVMHSESRGQTHRNGRPIVSRAGAMGLMQLMPGTWKIMRGRYGLGPDPHDPRDNILAGAAYLRAMHDRFGYPGLFAAYNAGPARYAEHLRTGRALARETRDYIAQLARTPATPSMPHVLLSGTRLFFALGSGIDPASPAPAEGDSTPEKSGSGGLFAPLDRAPGGER